MFTRERRIGRNTYIEALISYRDPDTGKPRHRCVARWRSGRTFAAEIGHTQFEHAEAQRNTAFWQGLIDGTVKPRFWRQISRAPGSLRSCRRRLATVTVHLTRLEEARASLPADEAEIEQARVAASQRNNAVTASFRPPDTRSMIAALAERARSLVTVNDPDEQRAGLIAIADALAGLAAG